MVFTLLAYAGMTLEKRLEVDVVQTLACMRLVKKEKEKEKK